jgi:hypothetical protein
MQPEVVVTHGEATAMTVRYQRWISISSITSIAGIAIYDDYYCYQDACQPTGHVRGGPDFR